MGIFHCYVCLELVFLFEVEGVFQEILYNVIPNVSIWQSKMLPDETGIIRECEIRTFLGRTWNDVTTAILTYSML